MPLLDALLAMVAPHECLVCTREQGLLCMACAAAYRPPTPSIEPPRGVEGLWVWSEYTGVTKLLLKRYKFDHAWAAHKVIASLVVQALPRLPAQTIVVSVPTASSRQRQRGYDHAALLARSVAARRGLMYAALLARTGQSRQVGATRRQRQQQLAGVFNVPRPWLCVGRSILLIDDVMTTGASLEAAATTLLQAGAIEVNALVFAYKN